MKKLSLLIPTTYDRAHFLANLLRLLAPQITKEIQTVIEIDDKEMSIGEKRNLLLSRATGEYVAFIDCDDEISSDYIKKILEAIKTSPDCCSLMGVYTVNGESPEIFEHSLKYKEWKTNATDCPRYERPPNHLNVIKKDIAIKYNFVHINHGEDRDWSQRIANDEVLKTESVIEGVIYHYKYVQNK